MKIGMEGVEKLVFIFYVFIKTPLKIHILLLVGPYSDWFRFMKKIYSIFIKRNGFIYALEISASYIDIFIPF